MKKSPRYRTAQAYFRGVLANERKIQYLEAEILTQQSRLSLNGVEGGEVVSKTMEGSALEQGFARLHSYCDELDTVLIGYLEERAEALEVISHIADSPAYEVITLWYFDGVRPREIEKVMAENGYRGDYIYELHRMAMHHLYDYLPRERKQRPQ